MARKTLTQAQVTCICKEKVVLLISLAPFDLSGLAEACGLDVERCTKSIWARYLTSF